LNSWMTRKVNWILWFHSITASNCPFKKLQFNFKWCFLIRKPQSPSEYSRLPKTFENFRQCLSKFSRNCFYWWKYFDKYFNDWKCYLPCRSFCISCNDEL
jgi:hypothetical protein